MEQKSNVSPSASGRGFCPYLGLHDDPATTLAYPSAWNYCYRANPPASILNSHQAEACLGPGYQQCPIYLAAEQASMPTYLRGTNTLSVSSHKPSSRRMWITSLTVLIVIVAAVAILLPRFVSFESVFPPATVTLAPVTFTPRPSATPISTHAFENPNAGIIASFTAEAQTRAASYTRTLDPTQAFATQTAARAATLTPATKTPTRTRIPSPTYTPSVTRTPSPTKVPSQTSTLNPSPVPSATSSRVPATAATFPTAPASGAVCGHVLDKAFGKDKKFTLHRVLGGENLTMYALENQTTTDAIIAVNYHLPLPVWADWVVVIPVGFSDVSGIPLFEPRFIENQKISMEELAAQLKTDLALLRQYNGFDEPCGSFNGWVLAPR